MRFTHDIPVLAIPSHYPGPLRYFYTQQTEARHLHVHIHRQLHDIDLYAFNTAVLQLPPRDLEQYASSRGLS